MKRFIALILLLATAPGCASYQLNRPLDGDFGVAFPNEPAIIDAMTNAVILEHPALTREEAEAVARANFDEYRGDIMGFYKDEIRPMNARVESAKALALFVRSLIWGP